MPYDVPSNYLERRKGWIDTVCQVIGLVNRSNGYFGTNCCRVGMSDDLEQTQTARGSGKWSQPAVPHKGWTCTGIDDLGAPDEVCEMCESQPIRYVHYMEHPDYANELGVGCVCAGHMEQDYKAARHRERSIKNAASRRSKWLNRAWKTSAKGNPFLNTDGFNIVLYKRGTLWSGTIANRETGEKHNARHRYATLDKAKLAAFDGMIFLKERI